MGQHVDAPHDLRDRDGRKLFQLQLDHRESLVEVAARELGHAQEHLFGREPGHIELALK